MSEETDPTSHYVQFDVTAWQTNGSKTALPSWTVKVWDATNAVALDDLESDGDGVVVAGTLPVAAGTTIWFRVENYQGMAGMLEQITT